MFKRITVVAYLGYLVLIPWICFPKIKYVRFHSNQGLILAILNTIFGAITSILSALSRALLVNVRWLGIIFSILTAIISLAGGIVIIYLIVVGIINAVKGRAKELPLIGKIRLLK